MYNELLEEAINLNQVAKLVSFIEISIEYSCNRLWDEMDKGELYLKVKKTYYELISLGFTLSKDCDFKSFTSDLAWEVLQNRIK